MGLSRTVARRCLGRGEERPQLLHRWQEMAQAVPVQWGRGHRPARRAQAGDLVLQQPQGTQGAAQQQAEARAARGPRVRSPCPVAVDPWARPVAARCHVLVLQAALPGPPDPPPAGACRQARSGPCHCPGCRPRSCHTQGGARVVGRRPHTHPGGPARAPTRPSPGAAPRPSTTTLGLAAVAEEGGSQQQSPACHCHPVHLCGAKPVGRQRKGHQLLTQPGVRGWGRWTVPGHRGPGLGHGTLHFGALARGV